MKFLYPLVLLFFTLSTLYSQSLEFGPVPGNLTLKNFVAQEELKQAGIVERMTGQRPDLENQNREIGECPPEFDGTLVVSGRKIVVTMDTFGLGKDDTAPVLTILNNGDLLYGTADITDATIKLNYTANAGFTGAGVDSVLVGFSQPAGDTTFKVAIHVKRSGKTIITDTEAVGIESITGYCFSDLVDFPRPVSCGEFLQLPNNYDGNGAQNYHFTSYNYPDSCLVYYASRFPGTDTVSVLMCDEWQVCDTFKIPFRIIGDTIKTLPFFDDFSTYPGPFPSKDYWLDKNVYVNRTLAKDPPSFGLVTFDGLDRRGDVYNVTAGLGDVLTSKPIDLSGLTPSSNVALRYFVAPKGYGLAPEKNDIFILEFRNAQRQWIPIDTIEGLNAIALDSFPPFQFYAAAIADPQFLHAAFQFRFKAFTSPGGEVDLWHLDYIFLDQQSTVTDFFPDFAFTSVSRSVLKNYTALPLNHLKADLDKELLTENDTIKVNVFNHFNTAVNFSTSEVSFLEIQDMQPLGQVFTIADANGSLTQPKEYRTISRAIPSAIDALKTAIGNIPDGENRNLQTVFNFVPNDLSEGLIFKSNNTLRFNNPFPNYFAHDDGTAEWQVYISDAQGGEQIATKFHSNVDDTLKAIQILFPLVNGNVQNQVFSLRVWLTSDLTGNTEPDFERELLKPFYANNVLDTIQAFTTYVLNDFSGNETPLFIPKGDFFIGIEQSSTATLGIPMGYDVQNHCACNWWNITGNWEQFPQQFPGSLMMRPVFGQITATVNSASENSRPLEDVVKIFPNPTSGQLNFQLKKGSFEDYKVFVFNNLGQMVAQQPMQTQMDLGNLSDGMYFLQIIDDKTGAIFSQRVLLNANRP